MNYYDFRSDTVTQPTSEMRKAMENAEVGDDVYGEDPTVNKLQDIAAEKMGMESGLFIPSGTMGNLIAVLAHCNRGDEVIMGTKAHTFLFEAGGISALGSVHPHIIANQDDGTLREEDILNAIRPDDIHNPISRLVILENTHNRCGGVALSPHYMCSISNLIHSRQLLLHLDGARIFNAAVKLGVLASELTSNVDSVTFCLSKGLCAPVGSVLCGAHEFINRARRLRKQLGGAMRQVGILAAAGIVALESMVDRLSEDHDRAKILADGLAKVNGLSVNYTPLSTNMVFVTLDSNLKIEAKEMAEFLKLKGVLVGVVGQRQFRLVTHYWINDDGVNNCIEAFQEVIEQNII